MADTAKRSAGTSPVALAGFGLAIVGAIVLASSGFGYRLGWWPLGTGFNMLKWGAYLGIGAGVICLLGLLVTRPGSRRGGFVLSLVGFVIAFTVFWMPYSEQRRAREVPAIHDITTDTQNPPQFVAVLPLRAGAPNTTVYGGPKIAALQEKAYPDIRTLVLPVAPAQAFDRALAVAKALGWHIDAQDQSAGRIEATDTTFWFGFKDDIVIRVEAGASGGSRVDIRSVSRIGHSDIGTNARRIRKFLAAMKRSA